MDARRLWGRLRGNPDFLARILALLGLFIIVIIASFSAVVLLEGGSKEFMLVIIGGVLGTLTALTVELIVVLLGKPDLSEIPMDLYESAKKEVLTTVRYYRDNCTIHIKLRKTNMLQIVLESEIYGKDDGGSILRAEIEPPKASGSGESSQPEHNEDPKHQIDKQEVGVPGNGGSVQIDKCEVKSEYIESTFSFCDSNLKAGIQDEHRWRSPVSGGFTVLFYLPVECECSGKCKCPDSKYDCHLRILRGYREDDLPPTKNLWIKEEDFWKKRFVYNDALFSQQGFHWSIKKKA